jgi:hypothetical protein
MAHCLCITQQGAMDVTGSKHDADQSEAALVAPSLNELRDALVEASLALKEFRCQHDAVLRDQVETEAGDLITRATQTPPDDVP